MLKLQYRNQPGQAVKLAATAVTLGRDASNVMVVDDASVSDFHAEVGLNDEQPYIVDLLSANGTFVNEERVSNRAALRAWDVIRLGDVEFEINDPNTCRPDDWALRAESDLLAGQFYVLAPQTVVGRSPDCDLTIDSELLSRHHAEISIGEDALSIKDLGSANGTFLNGEKITEAVAKPGDELRFDQQTFIVVGPRQVQPSGSAAAVDDTLLRGQLDDETLIAPPHATNATLVMRMDECATEPIAAQQLPAHLQEQTNFLQEPRIRLQGLRCQIGRGQENDILLSDSSVSKKHAELEFKTDHWIITDLNSSNGVWINGERANEAALRNGDKVKIGRLEFIFESEGDAPSVERLSSVLFSRSKKYVAKAKSPLTKTGKKKADKPRKGKPEKGVAPLPTSLLVFSIAATVLLMLYFLLV